MGGTPAGGRTRLGAGALRELAQADFAGALAWTGARAIAAGEAVRACAVIVTMRASRLKGVWTEDTGRSRFRP